MTSPRFRLASACSRQLFVLGICISACALTGCAPAPAPGPSPEAKPTEERSPATAEEVYQSYIDATNAIDLSDPETFTAVAEFTSDRLYASLSESWVARHEKQHVVGGKMVLVDFHVLTEYPDHSVTAAGCLDVSDLTMVDRHGVSQFPEAPPDFMVSAVDFIVVDGRLLLDSQWIDPIARCPSTSRTSAPVAPAPGAPDTPMPDAPSREQGEICLSSPHDDTVCGGW